jgi:hypothetical protein
MSTVLILSFGILTFVRTGLKAKSKWTRRLAVAYLFNNLFLIATAGLLGPHPLLVDLL